MFLRCFSDALPMFNKCISIIFLPFYYLAAIKIYSKHIIKSQYFWTWKTITFAASFIPRIPVPYASYPLFQLPAPNCSAAASNRL